MRVRLNRRVTLWLNAFLVLWASTNLFISLVLLIFSELFVFIDMFVSSELIAFTLLFDFKVLFVFKTLYAIFLLYASTSLYIPCNTHTWTVLYATFYSGYNMTNPLTDFVSSCGSSHARSRPLIFFTTSVGHTVLCLAAQSFLYFFKQDVTFGLTSTALGYNCFEFNLKNFKLKGETNNFKYKHKINHLKLRSELIQLI